MEGQKASVKSRKLGSSRKLRKQPRDPEEAEPQRGEEEDSVPSDMTAKLQEFFQECDGDKKGFITRRDMQKVTGNFPCSSEELELLFDGLDTDRKGYITTEELTAGIRTFVESQNVIKEQRRKRPSSKRISVAPNLPSLHEADSEERQYFLSFMEQLGANNIFEDESEIWKLWTKLRHDEPFLLGNLEEFLAKVTNEIKEARREKEALELTLKKRIAEHNEEVKQLYEEMQEQLNQERERMRNESDARSSILSQEMRKALDTKDKEVRQLVLVQNELEAQLHGLRSKQHVTSTENAQLKRTNQDLAQQLEGIREQLVEAQQRLVVIRKEVSPQTKEEKRDKNPSEETREGSAPQLMSQQDEVLSLELEPEQKVDPVPNNTVPDTVSHVTLPNLSEVADANSAPRIRVISIEEDPLPEFMNEDHMDFQNSLSHPRIPKMESLAEEAELTEMDGSLMPGTMSTPTVTDTEQNIRHADSSEPEIEISKQQALEWYPAQKDILDHNSQWPAVSEQEVAQGHAPKEEPIMKDVLIPHTEQSAIPAKEKLQRDALETKPEENLFEPRVPEASTAGNNFGRRGLEDDLLEREDRREADLKSNTLEEASEEEAQEKETDHPAVRLENALEEVAPEKDHSRGSHLQEEEELHSTGKPGGDRTVKPDPSTEARQNPDHVYKVLFVGDTNVGKTSFLNRLHDGLYRRDMTATIGLDYRIKTLTVDDKSFALQLWDTAGQERYHSITKQFFRKADGVIVMYDVTSRPSFVAVRYWIDCIKEKAGEEVLTLLLGNKIDCESERQVPTQEGKQLAEDHNLLFFECSAADGSNVFETMTDLARSLKAHEDILKHKVVKLRSENEKKPSCCM
ncbi:ras-related protein Rab-44 [Microcaecilia unicolor]|uniref:Ras-related protein Rab-44 n=1 Tax=Microcaecilia unicolor TaxID=1415580 RepID=A0A6P7ZTR2_9AMPH|nr:ras-related protein Rab-44 [Microcaecilia unicolor]XP_030077495.1 ras-related protein Rab-44 [Microcaecilia unicolor]XP_030077496.1 ras-related protein Rab-44 [Microcaecilia unicolor]